MKKMLGKILNTERCGFTTEQVLELYKNNLILCNDYSLTVITVPKWAYDEIKSITGIDINELSGTETSYEISGTKIDVKLKNRYSYPRLHDAIINDMYYDEFINKH